VVGLFVQLAVSVMVVPTVGDRLLAESVHIGAVTGRGCQVTVTLAGLLVPPLLVAVTV